MNGHDIDRIVMDCVRALRANGENERADKLGEAFIAERAARDEARRLLGVPVPAHPAATTPADVALADFLNECAVDMDIAGMSFITLQVDRETYAKAKAAAALRARAVQQELYCPNCYCSCCQNRTREESKSAMLAASKEGRKDDGR